MSHVSWRNEVTVQSSPLSSLANPPCWEGAPADAGGATRRGSSHISGEETIFACEMIEQSDDRRATGRSTTSKLESCVDAIHSLCAAGDCSIELTEIDGIPMEHFHLPMRPPSAP